jgi:hypothetical protein
MKDNGYGIWKVFDKYGPHDSRYWTMLLDPGGFSVWITCHFNREELNDVYFELDDGGRQIPRRFMIKTLSIETIISNLLSFGVDNSEPFNSSLLDINNLNEFRERREAKTDPEKTETEVT